MKVGESCFAASARARSAAAMVILLSTLSIAAHTDQQYFFKCPDDVEKGRTVILAWDVKQKGQARITGSFYVEGPATAAVIAADLAKSINKEVGDKIAAAGNDGEVDLELGWKPTGEDYGYKVDFGSFKTIGFLDGYLNFGPDLNTGGTYLAGPGSFTVAGPDNLYASFSASAGTSDNTLATEFASVMSADGYNAYASGPDVVFHEPAGKIEFTATGPGLDYGLESAPEPTTFAMLGSACLGIGAFFRRRLLT